MNNYCLMKFIIVFLCFLQNTVAQSSVTVVAPQETTIYPSVSATSENPEKMPSLFAFDCKFYIKDGDISILFFCNSSLECMLTFFTTKPLLRVQSLPALSQLTDDCIDLYIPFLYGEGNTTVVSQSQIKRLTIRTASKLSFYSGYFCNLHNVTVLVFNMSLNDPLTLGFNDDCSAIDCRLYNLNELILINNNMTVIQTNFFCSIPNLKLLQLTLNKIFSIEEDAFRTLNHLESLGCAENNLTKLPKDLFLPCQSSLKFLDLSGNYFSSDVFIALRKLSQLETLRMHQNKIYVLYGGYMKGLTSLKSLTLSGNGITVLKNDLLFLTGIEVIDLAYNLISFMSESSFSTFLNLTNLDLSNNHIVSLPPLIFKNNPKLAVLNMTRNKLRSIPELKYVTNLRVLKMAENQLQNITLKDQSSLSSAANLNMLDLSSNNISYVIPGAFSYHSNLTSVNLSTNKLKTISAMKSSSITTLYVDGNEISEFSFHDISTSLLYLYMRRNKIRDFYYDCTFPNISVKMETPVSLRHLDLSSNSVNFLYVSDNDNTSACLFGSNNPPTINFSSIGNTCDLMLKFKKNVMFPIHIFRIRYIFAPCEFDFWKTLDSTVSLASCNTPLREVFKNLNLLDKFTCAVDSRKTKEPPCQYNLYPEYYHQCGLHCPDGCQCFIGKQYDFHLMNCSNLNLTFIPSIHHMLESVILNFSGNHLTSLKGSMLYSYVNATELFLCHNWLLDIDEMSFLHFHLLEVLHLEYNQLTVIRKGLFKDLKRLKTLDVSHNTLIQIEEGAFQALGHVFTLALHENQLANMPIAILEDLTSLVLQGLSLQDNPWSCDCDFIVSFKEWLLDSLTLVEDPEHLVCMQDNESAIPVLTFNSAACISPTVVLLQNLSLLISVISVMTFITIVAILIYLYRKEMQVLVYSRYGIRLFQRNSDSDRDKRYDVFLAYSSLDGLFVVEQLLPGLEQIDRPYRVCVHQRDFLVGAIITDSILEAVEVSARTIVVLSENFVNSGFCRFEFKTAHLQMLCDRCARLIVIVLGDVPTHLDPEMKLYLKTNTYLEWGDRLFWQKLYFALPDRR